MDDASDKPIQTCPICFAYVLDHPTNSFFRKCPTCGFSYKKGDEAHARKRAEEAKKKASAN